MTTVPRISTVPSREVSSGKAAWTRVVKSISMALIFIFNVSINQGIVPDLMKIAKIRSIFKKCDRYDISNDRPRSIPFYQFFQKINKS